MQTEAQKQLKVGQATEKYIAKTLKAAGYWVYNIPLKTNGQPCDLIAIKGGKSILVWLLDAKHVREDEMSFPFSRIEPNQIASMTYATNFAHIDNVGFVIFFNRDKTLRYMAFSEYGKFIQENKKSVKLSDLRAFTEVLADAERN